MYPVFFVKELNELWSSLVASVSIPPRATRVEVMVDVGNFRRGDDTPERMEYMRIELEASMQKPWLGYHIGMELLLPEPVVRKRDRDDGEVSQEEDGAPPLKRRRVVAVVAGDECPICLDELETDDLVAWSGCSMPHVFHGECLQMQA
ncbi:hypothetical protein GUJ93_ZPchr0006g41252 [Zizania palustris]|uniref:Uncharacterized protein n=1 Tax=Zizania palustris TaxID=103762 RepID=A0A8J5TFB8_ZIZPA|nr:hypothetical protein GUJ93_ZPchr0006g41252 [Zizania palustris]